jgi:hypothetical protein
VAEYAPILEEHNWFIGETKTFEFTIRDEDKNLANIAGWTLLWALRVDEGEETPLISKTTGDGITITDGPNGICQVKVDATDTVALGEGDFAHALMRTDTDAETILSFGEAALRFAAVR